MKVLFDHQIFSDQVYGGISRYFSMLFVQLRSLGLADPTVGVRISSNHYLRSISYRGYTHVPEAITFRGMRRVKRIINARYCRQLLSEGNFDIFHPTNYDPYFLDALGTRPFVLTVYDLIHDLFPAEYADEPYFHRWMEMATNAASAIIAISASTKRDLVRIYGIAPERVSVVYLGGADFSSGITNLNWTGPERFILFVGDRQGYKNFDMLLEAIPPLLLRLGSVHLVCAGGGSFTKREQKEIVCAGLQGKVHQVNAADSLLALLYSRALALICPSRYEGFGMPILEAMECGCPVVSSNASSLPEIGGDAAAYVDPDDPENIRSALSRVLLDTDYRDELTRKGREQAQRFSWRNTAEETARVYRRVIGQHSR